ncbi:MAG: polysaccharide deacetylase family protein, partial [Deltaproteobacteria bacterium]|nr:polysaccharide deacetylase family protein [Deltaproteobacteria bacterium]
SREELLTLSQGELIEVGSHTVTHPFLSVLPKSSQLDEIRCSKTFLEESIGQPVRSFAYPYGIYAKETVKIVRKAGFDSACATIVDSVWRGSHRFQLPRLGVDNFDGEAFAGWLSQMFNYEMAL